MVRRTEKSMKEKKAAFMKKCNADPDFKHFPINKRILLYAVKLCRGHITNACAMVNITRKTFHNYRNDDPEFEEAFLNIKLGMLDHVVGKLFERIDAGSDSSIQFYLDRQGKGEGWTNTMNVDHTTKGESMNKALKNMTDEELAQKLKTLNDKMK